MADKKTSGKAMAHALHQERPAMQAIRRNLSRVSDPADVDAALRELAPVTPSAEYVALANQVAGNEPDPPEYLWADIREVGGPHGRQPLAKKATGRLPVQNPNEAAQLRIAQQAFGGAGASASAVDPRMLALALRGGR